ncbi:MAG: hypothetical protein KGZ25_01850, partial [Planctomycetes bacterium]|nr:hypothetical protein [Planctomycetota bacterium]
GRLTYPQPIDTGGKPLNIAFHPGSADRKAGLWCVVEKKLEDKEEKKEELFIVLLTESKGKYVVATETIAPGLDSAPERIVPINLNKDGRVDLICLRKYESPVLLVQKADGTFKDVTAKPDFRGHILRDINRATVHSAPLRKGTDPLIFVASDNLIRAVAFEKMNLVVKEQFSSERGNAKFAALHIADLDSDGENEILALDSNDDLLNFLDRDEKGIFQARRKTDVGSFGLLDLVRIDQDGDGQKEIVFVGTKKLGVMSRSASRPRLIEIGTVEADRDRVHYGQVLVGDLNNDGRSDLALRELAKHQLEIYSYSLGQRGNMNWESKFRFPVFESRSFRSGSSSQHGQQPRELVLGDVTGDGLTDMAIIVHDRVIVYPQQK